MKKTIVAGLIILSLFNLIGCSVGKEDDQQIVVADKEVTETKDELKILSSTCDMILAQGEGYVLVANQHDSYNESTVEVGVIKNNEWLVPLSALSSFVTNDGVWRLDIYSHFKDNGYEYIGDGCFIGYEKPELLGNNQIKINSVVYCAETNIGFYNCDFGIYQNFGGAYAGNNPIISFDYNNVLIERKFIAVGENNCLKIYDLHDGTSKNIGGLFSSGLPEIIGPYSEGLFYARGRNNSLHGFFDENGAMVIDLNEYDTSYVINNAFHNGEVSLRCTNPNGIEFNITIDKDGNVIKEEKLDS